MDTSWSNQKYYKVRLSRSGGSSVNHRFCGRCRELGWFVMALLPMIAQPTCAAYTPQPLILIHGYTGTADQWTDSGLRQSLERAGVPTRAFGFRNNQGAV